MLPLDEEAEIGDGDDDEGDLSDDLEGDDTVSKHCTVIPGNQESNQSLN